MPEHARGQKASQQARALQIKRCVDSSAMRVR